MFHKRQGKKRCEQVVQKQQRPSLFHKDAFRQFLHQCQYLFFVAIHKAAHPLVVQSIHPPVLEMHPSRCDQRHRAKCLQICFLSDRNKVNMVRKRSNFFILLNDVTRFLIYLLLAKKIDFFYLAVISLSLQQTCCLFAWQS